MKDNEAPCPKCGWPIAIYYDSPGAVGANLAGYYLSHAPWTPYPKWTDCALYQPIHDMPKYDTEEQAIRARAALATSLDTDADRT